MAVVVDPLRYLIPIWITIIFFLTLFKFNNWFDSLPSKKKDSKPSKEEVKKVDKVADDSVAITRSQSSNPVPDIVVKKNYLYDRFVDNPTSEDNISDTRGDKKIFLTDEENKAIRNNKVEIRVKNSTDNMSQKELLHNKIQEMTNENNTNKEKLLKEFEGLSKDMKLLLIENIISKM